MCLFVLLGKKIDIFFVCLCKNLFLCIVRINNIFFLGAKRSNIILQKLSAEQ